MKPNIVFVIPFISRHAARNFEFSSHLLEKTLVSASEQQRANVTCIVVSNDEPTCRLGNAILLKSDIHVVNPARPGSYHVDKERKLALGVTRAAEMDPDYVFCLDADDILSPHLSLAILRKNQDLVVLRSGWIFDSASRTAYPTPNFFRMCGSSLAFRPNLAGVPVHVPDFNDFEHEELKSKFWSISGHKQDPQFIAKQNGFSLGEVYLPLAYYRVWGSSLTADSRALRRRTVLSGPFMKLMYSAISGRVE